MKRELSHRLLKFSLVDWYLTQLFWRTKSFETEYTFINTLVRSKYSQSSFSRTRDFARIVFGILISMLFTLAADVSLDGLSQRLCTDFVSHFAISLTNFARSHETVFLISSLFPLIIAQLRNSRRTDKIRHRIIMEIMRIHASREKK